MSYELIEVRIEAGKVGFITLNRPKQLNALNNKLMDELGAALKAFDKFLATLGYAYVEETHNPAYRLFLRA